MGLKNRTNTGQYVKIKDGKFYLTKDETNTPFDELEGKLVDIYFKDESYEGKPQRKLYLVMEDSDTNRYIVGMRFDSRYATDLLSFIVDIDIKDVFTLHPKYKEEVKDGQTVKTSGLLISQDGTFAKKAYTKDHPNGLPPMRKVRISGKDHWDKEEMLQFFEDYVNNTLKPKLPKVSTTTIKDEDDGGYQLNEVENEKEIVEEDQLPF